MQFWAQRVIDHERSGAPLQSGSWLRAAPPPPVLPSAAVTRARLGGDQVIPFREEGREDLCVGSHGRWKRPCLQTAHMTI